MISVFSDCCGCDDIVRLNVTFSQSDLYFDGIKEYCKLKLIFDGNRKEYFYGNIFVDIDSFVSSRSYDSNRITYIFRDLIYISKNVFNITLDYESRLSSAFPYTWQTTIVTIYGQLPITFPPEKLRITI